MFILRRSHFGLILLLFLFLVPNIIFAEQLPNSKHLINTASQPTEWVKVDDGLYEFKFIIDISQMTENEKSEIFFGKLSQFKKDHSDEQIVGFQPLVSEVPSHSIIGYKLATEKKTINKTFVATIIAGIVTAFIGVITLWSNFRTNRKNLFVNTVTAERVKWMGQLREHVSEFLTLVTYHNEKNIDADQKERNEYLDNVLRLAAKIKLHLNHLDRKDQKIIKIVDEFTNDIRKIFETTILEKLTEEELIDLLIEPKRPEIDKEIKKRTSNSNKKQKRPLDMNGISKIQDEVFIEYGKLVIEEFKNDNETLRKRMDNNPKKLLSLTQAYLKDEWNRVKKEAESGNITKK